MLGSEPPARDVDLIATGLFDSLGIVNVIVELETRCGVRVPPERIDVDSVRTVAGLEALVDSARHLPGPDNAVLVPMRPGYGRPVFVSHSAHASALSTTPIVRELTTDRPIFALQAIGYRSDAEPQHNIEDMVATYVREMRKQQPEGPYTVLGGSFGGLIAFEIARLLTSTGQQVDLLGMLDPELPAAAIPLAERLFFHLAAPLRHIVWILRDPKRRSARYLRRAAWAMQGHRAGEVFDVDAVPPDSLRFCAIAARIEAKYRPSAYPGDAILFVATDHLPNKANVGRIWSSRISGSVEIVPVKGDHDTVFKQGMRPIGMRLNDAIAAAPSS